MPAAIEKEGFKQLGRLEQMHPDAAESGMLRTFLDWLVELPWSKSTRDSLDIGRAKEILDEDHFYLEKIKDRILEFLAVRKLKKKMKGPILCFSALRGSAKLPWANRSPGPMGRKFVRMSLGGVRDEAEIRGHRRTYVGALPGRILQGSSRPAPITRFSCWMRSTRSAPTSAVILPLLSWKYLIRSRTTHFPTTT